MMMMVMPPRGEARFYMNMELNQILSGNEVYNTKSLTLLAKNMLCSKLHCQKGCISILFSYKICGLGEVELLRADEDLLLARKRAVTAVVSHQAMIAEQKGGDAPFGESAFSKVESPRALPWPADADGRTQRQLVHIAQPRLRGGARDGGALASWTCRIR